MTQEKASDQIIVEDQIMIDRLHEILTDFENQQKEDEASVIRWAIFELEKELNITIGNRIL